MRSGERHKILSTCPVGQTLTHRPWAAVFHFISPSPGQSLLEAGLERPDGSLAQALIGKGLKKVTVLLGAASKEKLLPEEIFTRTGAEVLIATDDGSAGYQGFVTELLPSQVSGGEVGTPVVFACGPEGMLKAVGSFCLSNGIPCQLSLESVMACGVGACQGCVCRVLRRGSVEYVRVCTEGPVFDAGEVIWDD